MKKLWAVWETEYPDHGCVGVEAESEEAAKLAYEHAGFKDGTSALTAQRLTLAAPKLAPAQTGEKPLSDLTTEELAGILKAGHRAIISEGDEWRPLADHVLGLMALARQEAVVAEKLRADRAVEHSTEMESRAWAAEAQSSRLLPEFHKQEMQLHAARDERDEIRAELKAWLKTHPPSLCSAHQVLDLSCRLCNPALRRLEEVQAACAQMREAIDLLAPDHTQDHLKCIRCCIADPALASDAGKGWVSPEQHEQVLSELKDQILALCAKHK